jgi:3D (Asp-Asp-Asp) domain-containing protein
MKLLILSFVIILCFFLEKSSIAHEVVNINQFNFEEPYIDELGVPLILWATNYNLPEVKEGKGAFALRDIKGLALGPQVSRSEWCKIALEGSARVILKSGEVKIYNYAGTTEFHPIDCSAYFSFNVSKTKFRLAKGAFGDGVGRFKLTPYRTIATDPMIIPVGSVLYIPEARGSLITLNNGEVITHDGYFFAGDAGGGVKSNHIDVFIGLHNKASFFSWIKHTSTSTFKAYLVKDEAIIKSLGNMHLRPL